MKHLAVFEIDHCGVFTHDSRCARIMDVAGEIFNSVNCVKSSGFPELETETPLRVREVSRLGRGTFTDTVSIRARSPLIAKLPKSRLVLVDRRCWRSRFDEIRRIGVDVPAARNDNAAGSLNPFRGSSELPCITTGIEFPGHARRVEATGTTA
jgi:hypothetical protein